MSPPNRKFASCHLEYGLLSISLEVKICNSCLTHVVPPLATYCHHCKSNYSIMAVFFQDVNNKLNRTIEPLPLLFVKCLVNTFNGCITLCIHVGLRNCTSSVLENSYS